MPRKIDGIELTERNRFSAFIKPSDKQGMDSLASWQRWFQRKQIKSVIALTDKGFALYRDGMIDIYDEVE